MGIRIETIRYDDLDGSVDGVTSHTFALDGVRWEIDLSKPNLDRLHETLRPFIAAGRRLPASRTTAKTRRRVDGAAATPRRGGVPPVAERP
jgi:hypothetical protein